MQLSQSQAQLKRAPTTKKVCAAARGGGLLRASARLTAGARVRAPRQEDVSDTIEGILSPAKSWKGRNSMEFKELLQRKTAQFSLPKVEDPNIHNLLQITLAHATMVFQMPTEQVLYRWCVGREPAARRRGGADRPVGQAEGDGRAGARQAGAVDSGAAGRRLQPLGVRRLARRRGRPRRQQLQAVTPPNTHTHTAAATHPQGPHAVRFPNAVRFVIL